MHWLSNEHWSLLRSEWQKVLGQPKPQSGITSRTCGSPLLSDTTTTDGRHSEKMQMSM